MTTIPEEIRRKWRCSDMDVAMFLDHFDEPEGSRILIAGAKEENVAEMLDECGFEVTAVDLREKDENASDGEVYRIRRDFCEIDRYQFCALWGGEVDYEPFDVFIAISAIEHFGLGTYLEGKPHRYYDVIAMRRAWELLRVGGRAYVTVPFGKDFIEMGPHWRVYNMEAIRDRLVQDFQTEKLLVCVSGDCQINGRDRRMGDRITQEEAMNFSGHPPHVSLLVIMKKVDVKRLAPDGR